MDISVNFEIHQVFNMRNALEASLKMEHQERDRIMNSSYYSSQLSCGSYRDQINGCTHIMFCINVWFSLFFIDEFQFKKIKTRN